MVSVPLNWKLIDWMPTETWQKDTLPKLLAAGLHEKDLSRSVYVIRLNGDFCIQYPKDQSPTLYIGEGNLQQRIHNHKAWVTELKNLVGKSKFQICIALPRVKKNPDAYKDCEAALIHRFDELFNSAPLWNKQFESRRNCYEYNIRQMDRAIRKRSGAKYKWAVAPMPSSRFYKPFTDTHL